MTFEERDFVLVKKQLEELRILHNTNMAGAKSAVENMMKDITSMHIVFIKLHNIFGLSKATKKYVAKAITFLERKYRHLPKHFTKLRSTIVGLDGNAIQK